MVKVFFFIIAGIIALSMVLAGSYFWTVQTIYIIPESGESVVVADVMYDIEFVKIHDGTKEVKPEGVFFQISITAVSMRDEPTNLSGGQFILVDSNGITHIAQFLDTGPDELWYEEIEHDVAVTRTTQFDIEYNKDEQYQIIVKPLKEQKTNEWGKVCVKNCG
tara:strand:+ start:402 stop:890 length:489 start_codon:yes stop_codon:yes gene_type:complete